MDASHSLLGVIIFSLATQSPVFSIILLCNSVTIQQFSYWMFSKIPAWKTNMEVLRSHHSHPDIIFFILPKCSHLYQGFVNWNSRGEIQHQFTSVSHVWLFATPWTAACQASLSTTNSSSLLKLMSIESTMPSNHIILCRPPFPPAFNHPTYLTYM